MRVPFVDLSREANFLSVGEISSLPEPSTSISSANPTKILFQILSCGSKLENLITSAYFYFEIQTLAGVKFLNATSYFIEFFVYNYTDLNLWFYK